ncbi:hypothetical protein [Methylobacterium aquaticum]|uniref:hypothetical protein n=1 Tax=Methylobacterium aquaticum TaxID=270351 RepID=UPI001FED7609|nr:hypothetical protein [Methylobacterium aquaticum]
MTENEAALPDQTKNGPAPDGERLTLWVEECPSGMFVVTSPNPRGLLCTGQTMAEALAEVPTVLALLARAQAEVDGGSGGLH